MNAKFRLIDTGKGTYIELDGKTAGRGIDKVEYKKVAGKSGEITLHIDDVDAFRFEKDGRFDEVENEIKEYESSDSASIKQL